MVKLKRINRVNAKVSFLPFVIMHNEINKQLETCHELLVELQWFTEFCVTSKNELQIILAIFNRKTIKWPLICIIFGFVAMQQSILKLTQPP